MQATAELHRDGEEPQADGFVDGSLLAGYAHLHFESNPQVVDFLLSSRESIRNPEAGGKRQRMEFLKPGDKR
jgi:hypothetical protein